METREKISLTFEVESFISREVPKNAPKKAAIIITGSHCQCIPVRAPIVTAPTAFQMVATKTMVCMIALFSSSPNTPARVRVAKRPAPDERDPENMPIRQMHRVPISVLAADLFSMFL